MARLYAVELLPDESSASTTSSASRASAGPGRQPMEVPAASQMNAAGAAAAADRHALSPGDGPAQQRAAGSAPGPDTTARMARFSASASFQSSSSSGKYLRHQVVADATRQLSTASSTFPEQQQAPQVPQPELGQIEQ